MVDLKQVTNRWRIRCEELEREVQILKETKSEKIVEKYIEVPIERYIEVPIEKEVEKIVVRYDNSKLENEINNLKNTLNNREN